MTIQEQIFSTRTRVGALAGALLGLAGTRVAAPVVRAQGGPGAEPAFSNENLATLDLPGIELVQSADGSVAGLPEELEAGTYLVTLVSDGDFASYVNFVQPPAGLSEEEAITQMLDAAAMDVPHEGWLYGGGSYALEQAEVSFAIDLEPGEWQIAISRQAGDGGEEIMQLFPLTVTGEAASPEAMASPADGAVPANVILELRDIAFEGLLHPVQAGPNIWQVTNTGQQPRQVVFWRAPRQITVEEFQAVMMGLMSGTPVADGFDFAELTWVGYAAILSPSQNVWLELSLTAGDYLAVSYVFDPETQMPAFALGMVEPFTVVDESG